MENFDLPELPEGYRWYLRKEITGDPFLRLEKKAWYGWKKVDDCYVVLWHRGDFGERLRKTASTIMDRSRARSTGIPFGEVK